MAMALHVIVSGVVQGVFFRAWTKEQALQLGVAGWARNCADGSVEVHLEGSDGAVEEMVRRLRTGPPHARVDDLKIDEIEPDGFDGFTVRH
jgi:acylphosphatase